MMTINECPEDLALGYLLNQCDDVHLKNENDTDKEMSKLVDETQNLESVSMTNVNTLLASVSK